jgi:hypothetical protein
MNNVRFMVPLLDVSEVMGGKRLVKHDDGRAGNGKCSLSYNKVNTYGRPCGTNDPRHLPDYWSRDFPNGKLMARVVS